MRSALPAAVNDGLVPKGSVLLVEALDRVSRQSARKAVRILEDIVEGGITVVTLNDGKRTRRHARRYGFPHGYFTFHARRRRVCDKSQAPQGGMGRQT